MILFTADWHLKLGQKNVPMEWACARYKLFFDQVKELETDCDMHIIGGDLFDRVPSMDELTLYFDFISGVTIPTIIYDGNHEATRKNKTFFSNLKKATKEINSLVEIVDVTMLYPEKGFAILPYADLHRKNSIESISGIPYLFTHVRGEIPPHVIPEVDLDRFDKFDLVFAGDLHAHENTQRNIVYPGSPMTTSFHRTNVRTGYLLIDEDFSWKWGEFNLPQLLRKTVDSPDDMIATDWDHTIYELEGDVQDLALVKNSELLDKKVVKREVEATLNLTSEMTISDELIVYLDKILSLDGNKIKNIIGVYNDYSTKTELG
jgi:DNA repair exonuclease SbcCD nuclease subunit